MFAVGFLFYLSEPSAVTKEYENRALFRPLVGWVFWYMVLHPFWFGLVFATVYLLLLEGGCIAPGWRGGLLYGSVVFLVGSLPVFLLVNASFNVAHLVVAYWILQNACQYVAAGLALGLVASRLGARTRSVAESPD
jgi:hypothetical protein